MYQGDTPYGEAVTLSEENQWSHAWEELFESADWRVDEITDVKEYKKQVSRRGTAFTITNTYKEPNLPQTGLLWWPVPLLFDRRITSWIPPGPCPPSGFGASTVWGS